MMHSYLLCLSQPLGNLFTFFFAILAITVTHLELESKLFLNREHVTHPPPLQEGILTLT